MELARQELGIHLIVHPMIGVDRDVTGHLKAFRAARTPIRTSRGWITIEIDRTTDHTRLGQVERDLQRVLQDVRARSRTSRRCARWPA